MALTLPSELWHRIDMMASDVHNGVCIFRRNDGTGVDVQVSIDMDCVNVYVDAILRKAVCDVRASNTTIRIDDVIDAITFSPYVSVCNVCRNTERGMYSFGVRIRYTDVLVSTCRSIRELFASPGYQCKRT